MKKKLHQKEDLMFGLIVLIAVKAVLNVHLDVYHVPIKKITATAVTLKIIIFKAIMSATVNKNLMS